MSNKLLFGKELASYDDEDLDELLSKLTDEEIQQLNDDLDPDNTLLPPSQRCRDQTTKEPTGPLNREKLLRFLIDKAKAETDWDEAVPYQKVTRGKVFVPRQEQVQISQKELSELGFDVEFDQEVNEALSHATEDELVDLAAVLGFTGMMNQVQFYASLENRKVEGGGFSGVARGDRPKAVPDEPPNPTDVEASVTKVQNNDPELTDLNLNNIKIMSAEVVARLSEALKTNTKLKNLKMASTALTNTMIQPLIEMLQTNCTLQELNLESNFITGPQLVKLLGAINHEKSAITELHLTNQRQSVLGIAVEQELTKTILANPRLIRLGLDLDSSEARVRVREHIKTNLDRASRQARRTKA